MLLSMLRACPDLNAAGAAVVANPTVRTVTVATLVAGACGPPRTSASITVSWTETLVDRALHTVNVYENGVLFEPSTSTNTVSKTFDGNIEFGTYSRFTTDDTYRVDLVRKSDNAVISTATSAPWRKLYGSCSQLL